MDVRDPQAFLSPYVQPGMTVLEPGPGMGFFTLPMAQLTGSSGRVIAVDIQAKMLDNLQHRASKAGLLSRIETRVATADSLGVADLQEKVDFVLAYAMVHEVPSPEKLFQETAVTLKPGGKLLLVEPAGHVSPAKFASEVELARKAGLSEIESPVIRRKLAVLLTKKG
jgi:ubiquinone/menaquinone biosynthesis C-methylase UbiE